MKSKKLILILIILLVSLIFIFNCFDIHQLPNKSSVNTNFVGTNNTYHVLGNYVIVTNIIISTELTSDHEDVIFHSNYSAITNNHSNIITTFDLHNSNDNAVGITAIIINFILMII